MAAVHELRPFQREAYQSIVNHDHTILIAPTGSGKSLIFQSYLKNFSVSTRALFISPLNALARQQATNFRALGIPVFQGVGKDSERALSRSGVWILNPEKLYGKFRKDVEDWKPNLLIVDEAHCVWEWGQSFRREFAELPHLVDEISIQKSFWCTATLPKLALQQIKESLPTPPNILGQFHLPTQLEVVRLHAAPHVRIEVLRSLLASCSSQSGMIFVATRKASDRVLQYLRYWSLPAVAYHAGMSSEERLALEQQISRHAQSGQPIWIVATSAFGMGMDYPFLKTCILFEPSFNLLSLAQALGRVGRSAENSRAYVFWHSNDFVRHSWLLQQSVRNQQRYEEVREWCETKACPRAHLEKYFNGEVKSGNVRE